MYILSIYLIGAGLHQTGCEVQDQTRPPTCIQVRGPATDNAEHLWSAACVYNWSTEHCIESACIAFRGMP